MKHLTAKLALLILSALFLINSAFAGMVKGIYITQGTMDNAKTMKYLVENAKKVGIGTFIVDLETPPSKQYIANLGLMQRNGIHYVARIIVFPGGGTREQIQSIPYREKKNHLAQLAIQHGAQQIQLDYIRYNSKQRPSAQNAKDIMNVIAWFKNHISVPLQVDVFGIASFGESKYIGQNIKLIATQANVICPMVYPSHFEPYKIHAVTPYETVYKSLASIRKQFNDKQLPFKLVPYIELSNYRYPLSKQKKLDYIYAEIQAAEHANADGWYVWSPHNYYDNLFRVMETKQIK